MNTDNQEINSITDEENKDSMKTDSGETAAEKTAAEKTDSEKAEIPSLEAIEAERNRLSKTAEKRAVTIMTILIVILAAAAVILILLLLGVFHIHGAESVSAVFSGKP